VLFLLTEPAPAGGIEPTSWVTPWETPHIPRNTELVFFGVLLLLTVVGEELTFRLGIQNYFAGLFGRGAAGYRAAIVLSSALWSLGHIGQVDPEWVQFAQIFPVGLALGWLFRRAGFEACVIAHGVLNLVMPWLTPRLLA
jgi:membrane protease YdiL (CAAX protease family)